MESPGANTEKAQEIRERVKHIKTLPTLSGVVKKLCKVMESETVSTQEIAEIIGTDQVLTARVLKIVNSPFYGFPGRISTINHALVLLGLNVIKGIVLSAAVIDNMEKSIGGLWEHSLGVATATNRIAQSIGLPEPEEISTAGLLHDLGKVILSSEMPAECEQVLREVEESGISFMEAEKKLLEGITHPKIAGWLAADWNLPPRLKDPMVFHHHPGMSKLAPKPTAVVHLANILTRSLQFGDGGDPYIPKISPVALKTLDLRLADLAGYLDMIADELEGIDTSDFN
ncbi:MAG: HDOD domain-containing protein [Candidatus Sumerlaeia bacterium]